MPQLVLTSSQQKVVNTVMPLFRRARILQDLSGVTVVFTFLLYFSRTQGSVNFAEEFVNYFYAFLAVLNVMVLILSYVLVNIGKHKLAKSELPRELIDLLWSAPPEELKNVR